MKKATSLSIGDRDLPLEADLDIDFSAKEPLVGTMVKVSPVAGGDLQGQRGESMEITGVLVRFGVPVGFAAKRDGKSYTGSLKDFFWDRQVLEDIQPPIAISKALQEGLSHWQGQRTYWGERIDGLEAFSFELASCAPLGASVSTNKSGWEFLVTDGMQGRSAKVDCRAFMHDKFWTMSTAIVPVNLSSPIAASQNHWDKVFSWTLEVARGMLQHGFPWAKAIAGLEVRQKATREYLQPLIEKTLHRVYEAQGNQSSPPLVYGAFSDIRLKQNYLGLTEPPTDRRPYTVMSLSPKACTSKDHFEQVVLHECIHVAVASTGGEPHNEEFKTLAKKLGLKPELQS